MHVITGGAGFLGSALLRRLNELGIENILIVDNLGSSEKWRNLVKARYCDYMHKDRFLELVKTDSLPFRPKSVVHLGACSSTTERDCDFLMENNFHYSQAVCRYAQDKGARFINASSAATYGDGALGFRDDPGLLPSLRPLNMYAYSKHLFDLWLLRENLDASVISLKFFNVYGPNEYHKGDMASVVCKFFSQIAATGRAELFASGMPGIADGEQKRDFVYVKDCACLMAWLLTEAPHVNGIHNAGTGTACSFNDVARSVFAAMGKHAEIAYKPMPASLAAAYQNYTCADMSWLAPAGYPARFMPAQEGIADYVGNYLASFDRYL